MVTRVGMTRSCHPLDRASPFLYSGMSKEAANMHRKALRIMQQDVRAEINEKTVAIEKLRADLVQLQAVADYLARKAPAGEEVGPGSWESGAEESEKAPVDEQERRPEASEPRAAETSEFAGMTTVEATLECLQRAGPPGFNTRTLIQHLEAGGWQSKSANPYTSVFGNLNRIHRKGHTELDKRGAVWCLKSWGLDAAEERRRPDTE